jgi:hypothetical protein
MPEIPDDFIRSIVTLLGGHGRPIGTAFVTRFGEFDEKFFKSFYLITCEHCIEKKVKARFSTGKLLEIEPPSWARSPTGDDVVALDITEIVLEASGSIGNIDIGDAVQRKQPFFGIGTDLYVLGLSVEERDVGVNIPRARFGNLSAFADDRVPTKQGNDAERPCHLGDMRSRTGFSGSPVIGYLELPGMDGAVNYKNRLFGIHSAQNAERIEVFGPGNSQVVEIPSSMTRIVPAWTIRELLEQDHILSAGRERRRHDV